MPAFRLISVRGEEGVLRRQDAAFVGREVERATLLELFARATSQRRCLVGTVVGEAGVGKSRLVQETLGSIGPLARTLHGRCLPYGEGITFWPILDIVREAAGIQPEDPVGTAMDRLREASGDDRVAERVGAAIGFSSEPFPVSELFWGIRQFLERVAAEQPLVLVIDDIHWAESTLLDLLEQLNASLAAPVLVLATARHDLLEQRPTWGDGSDAARLELYRLSEAEAGQVIEHLLGDAGIADEVKRRIVTAAEGNPLFVEQLVSMLVGGGQLRMEDGRWVAAGDAADLAIPPTIQALLGSRLDQLAPNERSVIEPASVIGLEFRQAAVTELSPPRSGRRCLGCWAG